MRTVSEDVRIEDRLLVTTRPADPGPWPGVVMIHEAWGVDDVMRRQAERLASAGYVVLAPDLIGDGLWLRCIRRVLAAFTAGSGRPFELIEASRQRLIADPGCTGQVGVIGFCLGGGFALLTAARGFGVAAVNYGPPRESLEDDLVGACPVVASYGGRDRLATSVPRIEAALQARQVPHDLKVYPDAGHSFLNDAPNGPLLARLVGPLAHVGPEPASAADAWQRIEAFFDQHLSGPASD